MFIQLYLGKLDTDETDQLLIMIIINLLFAINTAPKLPILLFV